MVWLIPRPRQARPKVPNEPFHVFYPLAVFVHVVGVMALVGMSGLEWAILHHLRRESEPSQVTAALSTLGKGQRLIAIGVPLLLLSGFYLVWAAWAWTTPWILTGVVSMVVLGFLGGKVTGQRMGALISSEGANLEAHLPAMWTSFMIRASVLVAAVIVMCAKPGHMGSVAALAIAIVAGWLLSRGKSEPASAAGS